MNIHEYGNENQKTLVMIHGACMSWRMFRESAAILKDHFHIYLISVPGHDPDTGEEFTSFEEISALIEDELLAKGLKDIDLLYGLSMGGAFVIRILADQRLNIRNAVIDAGIAPYEMPYILTRLILFKDFVMTEWGKHSKKALELAFPPEKYTQAAVDEMHAVMSHMSAKSIWRLYDTTDNYALPLPFPKLSTKTVYWYGEKEKRARKTDIAYVKKHLPFVSFREIPGMDHGQYAMSKPREFALDLIRISSGKDVK